MPRLKLKCSPRNSHNSSLNLRTPQQRVAIRNLLQSPSQRLISSTTKIIPISNSIPSISTIEWFLTSGEDVTFNKYLCTISSIDSIPDIIEIGVYEVTCSEADRWGAGVYVVPVIVGVCDAEVAFIFGGVLVWVADQRSFPVIMDVAVWDCDVVCGVGEID